ncbi:ABC transporter permease [Clostridium sp.]|uniref:ABC transporter permease n=1 Tax=Clostridium sp. TaxID=1506 RepID=UPI002FDD06F4
MNLWKLLIKQIKAHPIATIFLIFGYIISIILISFGTSNMVELKQLALERTEGAPKNALVVNLALGKKYSFDKILSIFEGMSEDTSVIFTNIYTYIDSSDSNQLYPISAELFYSKPNWTYPIYSGRYYDVKDIETAAKVTLIGKDLDKYTYKKNYKKYLKIYGEEYEVIGLIGKNKTDTPWDSRVLLPISSIPKMIRSEFETSGVINCILHNNNITPTDDYNMIKRNVLSYNPNAIIQVSELESKNDVIANVVGNNDMLLYISVLIYLISLINSINITSYWINDRKFEIGVRKAFGHTNFNIASLLFLEIILINLVSCLLSLLIQLILNCFTENILGYTTKVYVTNFIISLIVIFVSSFITSIIPIYKSLKIEPIEVINK